MINFLYRNLKTKTDSISQCKNMPEGPEIHMAARFINQVAGRHEFGGAIVKSEVSKKNPDVDFDAKKFNLSAESRGKELKVFLEDVKAPKKNRTHILFRFGMSGCFKFTEAGDLPKHAHLRFFTVGEKPVRVLSFVDYRRFGRWEIGADWGRDRGPDPMFDYDSFRKNVLDHRVPKNSLLSRGIRLPSTGFLHKWPRLATESLSGPLP